MASKLLPPTSPIAKALTKALGTVNSVAPQVEYLQELAKVCPDIAGQVEELGLMHEHLDQLCRVGLGGQVTDAGETDRG